MARKLNPEYIRRIMRKRQLRGLEAVLLTGEQFGVSVENKSLLGDNGWIDDDAPRRYAEDRYYYKGWGVTGRLYCAKCWSSIVGVPRGIIARNWCESCNSQLYAADNEQKLDFLGLEIYRDRVTRYMQLAVRRLGKLIEGSEHISAEGGMKPGYHKDHIVSVREGFENDIDELIISSPPNIRVLAAQNNLSKGRRSGCSLKQLLDRYQAFLSKHPEWLRWIKESDRNQETFIFKDEGGFS